jgi:superfamily II DNA or RNA helicase
MPIALSISPNGRLFVENVDDAPSPPNAATAKRIAAAFAESQAHGLLHLATDALQADLTFDFAFAREFARNYLTQLCHTPEAGTKAAVAMAPAPAREQLETIALSAPPMRGAEYLQAEALRSWWTELGELVHREVASWPGGLSAYLQHKNPLWRTVGRVTFHLAENKRNADYPFAFLATYTRRISAHGQPQHRPLGEALQEYAAQKNRAALVSLLAPVNRAAGQSALIQELVASNEIFQPQAWTPREAYRFLKEIPAFEQCGLIVQVPDWWQAERPRRPVVSVTVGERTVGSLGVDALLDFSAAVTLEGEPLSQRELQDLFDSQGPLVSLKGRWVEVDREKLSAALRHWKHVERDARGGGLSFFEGMRLLSGVSMPGDASAPPATTAEWTGVAPGKMLADALHQLRSFAADDGVGPPGLETRLRPYQQAGVRWLRFLTGLGLGACLADDMGLGKTIQVIGLLLFLKAQSRGKRASATPHLLVVPASLVANWQAELSRFAPSLSVCVIHPSALPVKARQRSLADRSLLTEVAGNDLAITTYGMLPRLDWLGERPWNLVILDEAQAIKNAATRQARSVRQLKCSARIALTGTPVENRLSDLWSLFDFLNPGLLGSAKAFTELIKKLEARQHDRYGPLRALIQPYLLRRLKTDKRVISDLPEKTEINAFCNLSKRQCALYQRAVEELAGALREAEGIQRRGIVLASLMRLKQICNHPSQATGDAVYDPDESGKYRRLREICEELAARQQKTLVFTQFREMTAPLAAFLGTLFGRPGLVLHGQTPVGKRRELVQAFQRDDGPPFFVLSLKAGGVGLNLTAASHVIHFDRWWNPAVENQATDRVFRIGQKRNVLVYKFVCRGTIEERIDELIAGKSNLAKDLVEGGGEPLLTEMDNDQLLQLVSLDIHTALAC